MNTKAILTTRLSEEAVNFIDRSKRTVSPFFLYLAYNAVHAPAQAPEEDIDYYRKKYPGISEAANHPHGDAGSFGRRRWGCGQQAQGGRRLGQYAAFF